MMINLNKKEKIAKGLPLAIKVMSLIVMMNLVGCNGCKSDNNEVAETAMQAVDANHGIKFSIQGETIYGAEKKAKITIVNEGNNEYNPETQDFDLVVYKPKMKERGYFANTADADANFGKFTIEGLEGTGAKETKFELKKLLKDKKIGAKQKLTLTFEFTGIIDRYVANAEFSMEVVDKKGVKVSESPAKAIWKYKK